MLSMIRSFVLAVLAVGASLAHADIYRCVDTAGKTSYSDSPCASNAKSASNITEDVGACTTLQCEEQRRQQSDEARKRLEAEKQELNDALTRRQKNNADYDRERARLEEERYRRALEERLAAMADQAALGANGWYYSEYPGYYPGYPIVTRPCVACKPHPTPLPGKDKRVKEPSVRLRLDR